MPASPSAVPVIQRPSWQLLQVLCDAGMPHLRQRLAAGLPASGISASTPSVGPVPLLEAAGIELDASRQRLTPAVWQALLALAEESGVAAQALSQRRGDPINLTEGRAVLHVALRGSGRAQPPWGAAIDADVQRELGRFLEAAEQLRNGQWTGHRGQRITDVVNLGIGGSDLGPRMAVQALGAFASPDVRLHFVSNPDAWALHQVLRGLHPDRTVFIVQSKTFTTQETLTLAASAQAWLAQAGLATMQEQAPHRVAVTASPKASLTQGYAPERTFGFWDWVGGRYSVWSAIGLPLAVAIGAARFREFLDGAQAMDQHFWHAPALRNMPLALALLGIWNRNFLGFPAQLISPYASRLIEFPRFLQQMEMESNGKRVCADGSPCSVETSPILWGGLGIDGQHAYFQLLHQGMHTVPVDFIGVRSEDTPLPLAAEHHRVTLLNLQAQAQALAVGRDEADTAAELRASGLSEERVQALLPHRVFAGNVPSSILWLPEITPRTLGALVALYEHKVFCQAAIWGINAYDQWGVELGKSMARAMEANGSAGGRQQGC